MRLLRLTLAFSLFAASTAQADYPEAVRDILTPGYAAFETAALQLAATAQQTCDAEAIIPAWHAAFDAWLFVAAIKIGPVEQDGMGLAIAYWPDPKGLGAKAQRSLLTASAEDLQPEKFAHQSVAARGLTGLERLLWPNSDLKSDPCPLIRATADDLARMSSLIRSQWESDFAKTILTAGAPENSTFLTRSEVRQSLFTQIDAELSFDRDQRLGRPLGSFDRPRPELAEARASGRSLRNVTLSLRALRALSESLTPDIPKTLAAFDHALTLAEELNDPTFDGVADPATRLKVEILQQAINSIQQVARQELARDLDVDLGFNAADGD